MCPICRDVILNISFPPSNFQAVRSLVIAIDGPAASGKSTTAQRVARRLGYLYIDTGAMYRAVTLAVLRRNCDPGDRERVEAIADTVSVELEQSSEGSLTVRLDGEDVSRAIRTPEVTACVSQVSQWPGVRARMVQIQKRIGANGGVVLDGRDIGTVVFPDADVKVFMVADLDARARRRHAELERQGAVATVEGLADQIAARDRTDSSRKHSPLVRAQDAVEIDTSGMTIDEQVERVIALARTAMQERGARGEAAG